MTMVPRQRRDGMPGRPSVDRTHHRPDFRPGGEFTLGAEEESLLVRPNGHLLSGGAEELVAAVGRPSWAEGGAVVPEIFTNQIELVTPVCRDAEMLVRSLADLRSEVRGAGAWIMAIGHHPAGQFGDVQIVRSAHYDRIAHDLAGLLRSPTSSLQVHVGLPDEASAIAAYRGLRHHLPLLRAMAANSPMWFLQDSGLVSTRSVIMRGYPRAGIPPAASTFEQYVESTARVLETAEVPDHSFIWWDMRLQPQLGTVEVRVMDSQASLERAAGLAALIQGIAMASVESPPQHDLPSEVLSENDFRAFRYGLDARVVDANGMMRPLRIIAGRSLKRARDALHVVGRDGPLDAVAALLWEPSEASRQRRLVAQEGIDALLQDLTVRTNAVEAVR